MSPKNLTLIISNRSYWLVITEYRWNHRKKE